MTFKLEAQVVRGEDFAAKVEPQDKTERTLPPVVLEAIAIFDEQLVAEPSKKT